MGLVITVAATILYILFFLSLNVVYVHTDIQWEEISVQSFFLFCFGPWGMLSIEKKSLQFKGQKVRAVKYL